MVQGQDYKVDVSKLLNSQILSIFDGSPKISGVWRCRVFSFSAFN